MFHTRDAGGEDGSIVSVWDEACATLLIRVLHLQCYTAIFQFSVAASLGEALQGTGMMVVIHLESFCSSPLQTNLPHRAQAHRNKSHLWDGAPERVC